LQKQLKHPETNLRRKHSRLWFKTVTCILLNSFYQPQWKWFSFSYGRLLNDISHNRSLYFNIAYFHRLSINILYEFHTYALN